MTMQTSTAGLMAIAAHEGIVLTPYKDSVGVWTIGVGHTAAAGKPDPKTFTGDLTVSEAIGLLHHDILKYERDVNAAVKVPVAQHEFDALVSFHYNTGGINRASLVKSLNAGNRTLAAQQFMNWTTPKEITARRAAERDLFAKGTYPEPIATLYPADKSGKVLWSKAKRINLRDHVEAPAREPDKPSKREMPTLQLGSKGDDVKTLQRALNARGRELIVDGDFGAKTKTAVEVFQQHHALWPDGIVGPRTWDKLI